MRQTTTKHILVNGQMFRLKEQPDYHGKDAHSTPLWVLLDRVDVQGNSHIVFCGEDKTIQIALRDPFIAQTTKAPNNGLYDDFEDFRIRFNLHGENLPVLYSTGGKF
jgi:hypothetical protein